MPFHPLDLGEEALRFFFGFVLEGRPEPEDIDPYQAALRGFRRTVPDGSTLAEKEATMRAAISRMRSPRILTYGPDGRLVEIDRL